jgi:signal transduction histidine kinase
MLSGAKEDRYKVKTDYFVRSLLNVPLKVQDQVIGVLAVHNKSVTKAFTDRHLNLLMALADYASIAIDNARLYARLASDVSRARESSQALKRMVRDRTDALNRVNQQLVQTEKMAALGYFAAGVAHEIRTPINVVLDHLHQLEQRLEPKEGNQQLLASLEQQALHCQQTIQSLLDFSGQKGYHPQPTDLNEVVEAAWSKYAHEYDSTDQVEFVRGLDPQLPLITVDGEQLKQALFYLIRNAYRSMPQGGLLRIITRAVGDQIQLIVDDNGRGLTKEDMQHIFDPFYRATHQTYGMDLSITQAVIERHNGAIEVESEPGQGTTFTIHLPLKRE